MWKRLEDIVGKALIVCIFYVLAVLQLRSIYMIIGNPGAIDNLELVLISRVFSFIFLMLVIYLTIRRLPPKDTVEGVEPRISAIGGTFILMLLIVLPTGSVAPELRLLSTLLIVTGTLLSIYCLHWLGRSFSIMATSRELVTHGPYSIVRHPLYLTESLTVLGIVISNWSLSALLVGTVQFALQFRRMYNEEKVLRRSFPEYEDYAERTPLFIPLLRKRY